MVMLIINWFKSVVKGFKDEEFLRGYDYAAGVLLRGYPNTKTYDGSKRDLTSEIFPDDMGSFEEGMIKAIEDFNIATGRAE